MVLRHEEPAVAQSAAVVHNDMDMRMRPVSVQCRDIGPDIILMLARLKHLKGPNFGNQLRLLRPHMGRKAQKQMAGVPVLG